MVIVDPTPQLGRVQVLVGHAGLSGCTQICGQATPCHLVVVALEEQVAALLVRADVVRVTGPARTLVDDVSRKEEMSGFGTHFVARRTRAIETRMLRDNLEVQETVVSNSQSTKVMRRYI